MLPEAYNEHLKLFAVGETIAILISAHHGLGQPVNHPDTKQIIPIEKVGFEEITMHVSPY